MQINELVYSVLCEATASYAIDYWKRQLPKAKSAISDTILPYWKQQLTKAGSGIADAASKAGSAALNVPVHAAKYAAGEIQQHPYASAGIALGAGYAAKKAVDRQRKKEYQPFSFKMTKK